jgi:antiphage defense system Thoeris ThsB-like protein
MFRSKRSDTKVSKIEATYGIDLNVRGDMRLGNLLKKRGFDSQSQLLDAYRGKLSSHSKRRKTFLSFHAEDIQQVRGFRLMCMSKHVDVDIYDGSVREAIDSEDSSYVKQVIREKIRKTSVLICLIGNGTAWRDWVDWEIQTAYELGKGVCGVRLKGSRGRTPPALASNKARVARWNLQEIVAAIECAAAKRS